MIRHLVLRYLAQKSCHSGIGTESSDSDEDYDNEAAASCMINGLETSPKQSNHAEYNRLVMWFFVIAQVTFCTEYSNFLSKLITACLLQSSIL